MIVICVGRRELGKSTLALYFLRQLQTRVIADPRHQFSTDQPIRDLTTADERLLWDRMDAGLETVWRPESDLMDKIDASPLAVALKDWVQQTPEPISLGVLLDECALLDLSAWGWMFKCVKRNQVYTILTAHRPVDIAPAIRSIADFWCVFKTTQESDLELIEEKCGTEFVERVKLLGPHEFLLWDEGRAEFTPYTRDTSRGPSSWFVSMAR